MTTATERANQARSEDLDWLATWHNTPREAARLGISTNALEAWARRNDPEVLERLRENERRRKGCVV